MAFSDTYIWPTSEYDVYFYVFHKVHNCGSFLIYAKQEILLLVLKNVYIVIDSLTYMQC